MMVPIAVCLGFRNWHLEHLDRCLVSLTSQQGARFTEISLVDLGSDDSMLRDELAIARRYGLSVLVSRRDEWSRSAALNLAARASRAPWLFFTDADMLLSADFLARAQLFLPITIAGEEVPEKRHPVWLTRSRDFGHPSVYDDSVWVGPHSAAKLHALTTPHDDVGEGGGMLVPRAWFDRVGGFDESYAVWGAEDNDLTQRARWDGLRVEWLPELFVAHQWHPRDWPTPAQYDQVRRNREYYAARLAERGPIVRNRRSGAPAGTRVHTGDER